MTDVPDDDDDYDYCDVRPSVAVGRTRPLTELVALHLQRERADRGMTQATMAERLGVTQQWLSKVERGTAHPTLATVERMFAALDLQLRVEVEPLGIGLDEEIDRYSGLPEAERIEELDMACGSLLNRFRDGEGALPYVISGRVAAFVQGAPARMTHLDLAVAERDLGRFAAIMTKANCRRWDDQWVDWGYSSADPRRPGPMRWSLGLTEFRMEVSDDLPDALEIRIGTWDLRVRPLAELEIDHPDVGRIMRRVRARGRSPV